MSDTDKLLRAFIEALDFDIKELDKVPCKAQPGNGEALYESAYKVTKMVADAPIPDAQVKMTVEQELEQLKQENKELRDHVDELNGHLGNVCSQRDNYSKTLQEVCIELARRNNEKT